MHNKFLEMSAAILLFCALLSLSIRAFNIGVANINHEDVIDVSNMIYNEFQKYDNTILKGADVIEAVKKYAYKYKIVIKNGAYLEKLETSNEVSCFEIPRDDEISDRESAVSQLVQEMKGIDTMSSTPDSIKYVNENAPFEASIELNGNQQVETLLFTQILEE